MIKGLKKRFILISSISVVSLILLIFFAILLFNISSLNKNMDILADTISDGGGRFPSSPSGNHGGRDEYFGFITPETPFSTRYFTVVLTKSYEVISVDTDSIYSVNASSALEYASRVLGSSRARGWADEYRYKIFNMPSGNIGIVFVDGAPNISMLVQSSTVSGIVLLVCGALVLAFMILLSGRIIRPIAQSYEKQRQFITDANHELKTPLTLILANLDLAESELGENEWLDDIRSEGGRMAELIEQLGALSRMGEDGYALSMQDVALGKLTADAVEEFEPLAEQRDKSILSDILQDVSVEGDEMLIRRLISILLDNAVKYCDVGGNISVSLKKKHNVELVVENNHAGADSVDLDKVFDRFYRADRARTYGGGHGIGLSIAHEIVRQHGGTISAYKKDGTRIGFKVVFKK